MSSEHMRTKFPGAEGKTTSRLGLGFATLMREGSRRKREYVFDVAYERGFRHFDVAPLYGLGYAESDLGRLLRRSQGGYTVGSKFGLRPSKLARAVGLAQGPLRSLLQYSSALKRLARSYSGSSVRLVAPRVEDILSSLDSTLMQLGVDELDLLLIHDMEWNEEWSRLWQQISARSSELRGSILGVSCDSDEQPDPLGALTSANVLQVPGTAFIRKEIDSHAAFKINFGLLAREMQPAHSYLDHNRETRGKLENLLGTSLRTASEVGSLLATMNLAKDDSSILLVGTTKATHVTEIWNAVEAMLPVVQCNRAEVLQHLTPVELSLK